MQRKLCILGCAESDECCGEKKKRKVELVRGVKVPGWTRVRAVEV
jgi:hypothetical protein